MTESKLILPGDIGFQGTLDALAVGFNPIKSQCYIQRPGSLLVEPATYDEAIEYAYSDDYEERMAEIEDQELESDFNIDLNEWELI